MPGVVLVNPHAGPDETSPAVVAAEFPGSELREIEGKAVRRQIEEAVAAADPDFLAVAGGDGTIRCAAGVIAGTDVALVPVPAGTRNHFAKEVGIATVEAAGAAAAGGRIQLVDVGEVNGEVFVNNANVGAYPRMVSERQTHERRWSKRTATLVAGLAQLGSLHKFTVTVDGGESHRAWMVFVGNGRYGTSVFDVGVRESLDGGLLDVRILRADGRLARLRAVLALVAGRVEASPMAELAQVSSVELAFDRARIEVALDGELVPLSTPLRFRCRPGALRVLVPAQAEAAAS